MELIFGKAGHGGVQKPIAAAVGLAVLLAASIHVSADSSGFVLEEVIVTAQKREQNLQDVPVSVTAFSGDALEKLGFESAGDIAGQIPNVQFNDQGSVPQFNIRGVQLNDYSDGNEPPVGFYADEVYKGTMSGQTVGLFDVERIEVLRGPQGTIFGRNTTGGLVHVVSRKPTEELEGYLTLDVGSFDHQIIEGAIGGALSDTVRGRIAIKENKDHGTQINVNNGNEFNVTDTIAVRTNFEIDVSDDALLALSFYYSDQDSVSPSYGVAGTLDPATFEACDATQILTGSCVDAYGSSGALNPREVHTDLSTLKSQVEIYGGNARLDLELGDELNLVSITAFESIKKFLEEDGDASIAPVYLAEYSVGAEQFSQEFRLSGGDENSSWLLGAFYYQDEKDDLTYTMPQITGFVDGDDVGINNESIFDTRSWAVFGQTDFILTDTLEAVVGLRYTDDKKELRISNDFDNPAFINDESISTQNVTWKAGLNWTPLDETLVYASVSKGFKSGAFRTTFVNDDGAAPVGEEEILSYEVGFKSDYDWGRINGSVFYSDYTDLQANSVTTINGLPATVMVNIGDADIYGAELEVAFVPAERLEVILGLGYLDSEVTSEDSIFDGNELAFTPSLTGNGVVRYTFPNIFDGYVTAQTTVSYNGAHSLVSENTAGISEDGYTLYGARVGWYSDDDKYSVEGFVENLTDEEYFIGGFSGGPLAFNSYVWGTPRLAGVKLGVNF